MYMTCVKLLGARLHFVGVDHYNKTGWSYKIKHCKDYNCYFETPIYWNWNIYLFLRVHLVHLNFRSTQTYYDQTSIKISADDQNSMVMQSNANQQYHMQVEENPMTMVGVPSNGKPQSPRKMAPVRQCKATTFISFRVVLRLPVLIYWHQEGFNSNLMIQSYAGVEQHEGNVGWRLEHIIQT